jgi:hypothetical protein
MKQLKIKSIAILFTLLILNTSEANQSDSIKLSGLENRIEKTENFQSNTKDALEIKFDKLKLSIDQDYSWLKYLAWSGIGFPIISFLGLWWRGQKYIGEKLTEKFDKIITQEEGNILAVIEDQDKEKQIVKGKKILVLTSTNGDDIFLRKFFKTMGFPINNVDYKKVDSYKKFERYDLIFANNEDNSFDIELIQDFFQKSDFKTVLFFFGDKYPRASAEANRMNLANSRTQVYGNLINLLKYQEILK